MKEIREKLSKLSSMEYLIHIPNKYNGSLPMILFLHGVGERGNRIDDIKKYALPKYINKLEVPYIVISPQCHKPYFWDYHLRDVEQIIKEVSKKYNGDKNRICIMGSSMGAFGAWNYIMQRPDLFKCIVSVSGGAMLPIYDTIGLIKNKSILIYHGNNDSIVDVNKSIEIHNILMEQNAKDVELKIIEGETHFLSSHAFKDSYIFEWLDKRI